LREKNFFLLLVFIVLGILLSIQFRSTFKANLEKTSARMDADQIIKQIENEKKVQEYLNSAIDNELKQKDNIIKEYMANRDNQAFMGQWDSVMLKAGLVDVKGKGIIIRLDDADPAQEGNPLDLIIHDQDIKIIINDLKKAGAQAISINGERITAMSELVCAGPTILINRNRYVVPFVINVIGDPKLLYGAVDGSQRIALMRQDKIRVQIEQSDEIMVPKFRDIDHNDLLNSITGLEVVKNENN
jgi:uncharacterized protein YlxW (UPF0749 family)